MLTSIALYQFSWLRLSFILLQCEHRSLAHGAPSNTRDTHPIETFVMKEVQTRKSNDGIVIDNGVKTYHTASKNVRLCGNHA
jgi:hypothetical protein